MSTIIVSFVRAILRKTCHVEIGKPGEPGAQRRRCRGSTEAFLVLYATAILMVLKLIAVSFHHWGLTPRFQKCRNVVEWS